MFVFFPEMPLVLVFFSFFLHPQMAEDLIETYSMFSHALVSFSIGEYGTIAVGTV